MLYSLQIYLASAANGKIMQCAYFVVALQLEL
jgi:hypothetical protein